MEPLKLGHAIRKAMNVTAVKLPQTTPPKPTTPFDVKKLEIDLRGDAQFRPDRRFVDEDILLARNVNGNDAARPDIGCLYNQETDEVPQLYFSHMWKTGSPYDLAQSVRKGLLLTNSALTS
jgi:hypothetical protein